MSLPDNKTPTKVIGIGTIILFTHHLNIMSITIYHNPRCSKSRATLQILSDKNKSINVVKYLETPPTAEQLSDILNKLNLNPEDIIRKNETDYKTSGLDNPNLSRAEHIDLMVQNPIVIERPIVVSDTAARIGRPPENILDIL